ncbi:MAG: aspartate kinase, partial [Myxococcales bacterium]|nr:aspartate kinase [Myxococcales bacterium]
MRPVVMKFGGSSVADLERLRRVARRVVARAQERKVAVVVSAMGKTTNNLVAEACALLDPPPARELDMLMTTGERISMALLAIAIAAEGRTAISLTGSQCGIITNHQAGRARIVEVRPFRVEDEWAEGHVVIVGGFAGVSYKREVTTLGRGGSDTTAVA